MECQLADRSVFYKTQGQGKRFITISGIPSDHHIIESWMEPIFTQRPGWQRVYFDLPGTGHTSGEGIYSIDQILDVVCDFIDALIPNQAFTLLGLSVGGYLARGVLLRKADLVDGVCLLVPWLSERERQTLPEPAIFFTDAQALAGLAPKDADILANLAVVQTQEIVGWYRDVVLLARQGPAKPSEPGFQRSYSFDMDAISTPFQKPSLILLGRQDTHVGYQDGLDMMDLFPRATLAVLDRAGHALGMEQAPLFQALIHEWLDRVEELQP